MTRRIVQESFGGPEALELTKSEPLTAADLGQGEVLVDVVAAGVNPIDVMTRTGGGMAATGAVSLPFTPGWDTAGTVAALGSGVTGLAIGDRVLGLARFPREGAAYAEQAVVSAADLIAAPARFTDEQAGAFPMAAMTAWQALAETTHVAAGDRVLVTGAGGGVGHMAVQIAHALGAHVTALASAGKHEWLRSLGADETVDYHDDDAVGALAGTVDTALSLAPGSREAALRAVRRAGDVVALGLGATDLQPEAEEAGVRLSSTHVHTQREWLEAVVDLAERGAITPLVSRTLDLADAADAHRAVEGGHSTGKIVLTTAY